MALINPPNSAIDRYFTTDNNDVIYLSFKNTSVLPACFSYSVNNSQNQAVVLLSLQSRAEQQYYSATGYFHISMSTPMSALAVTAKARWEENHNN